MTDTAFREPWETSARQHAAMQFGVWAFLATETLFFGGLFLFYAHARTSNPAGFIAGAHEAEAIYGSVNTVILLTSSLTMAITERGARERLVTLSRAMLAATIALGLAFLVVKGFEYKSDIEKHLVPGPHFRLTAIGASQFWAFYWVVTIVHAIHLTTGLGFLTRLLLIPRAALPERWTTVEGTALYWHLVDLVWIVLYPLLYLVGR